MNINFVTLVQTTPFLANALVYHLQQAVKSSSLESNHILTIPTGVQVEVRVSQAFYDWITYSRAA